MTVIPQSILDGHVDLNPEALVTLYEVDMAGQGTVYISPMEEIQWLGKIYERLPAHMADIAREANGKLTRPKFSLANPEGMFSADIASGRLDTATVTRIRALRRDVLDNLDFSIRETLNVARVISMSNQVIVMELRDALDGNQFQIPARRYMPPEFPHVQLN